MVSSVESIGANSVTSEIDNIFGEIEKMVADYQPSNIEIKDDTSAAKMDVTSARENILKSV
jgi:hypothetical protein